MFAYGWAALAWRLSTDTAIHIVAVIAKVQNLKVNPIQAGRIPSRLGARWPAPAIQRPLEDPKASLVEKLQFIVMPKLTYGRCSASGRLAH
jgi:hypothetical protein